MIDTREHAYRINRELESHLVKARIVEKKLSMKQLAAEYGCSIQHLSLVVNGLAVSTPIVNFLRQRLDMKLPIATEK